jgi:hypothetical protein
LAAAVTVFLLPEAESVPNDVVELLRIFVCKVEFGVPVDCCFTG